ncbi:hypothetical protein PoB_000604000 [Plakobranchus ocellatus]|uniref:Uncharacterized protein n=1 Tax=Plakobranchus ocellatus TaxID=259542 RepID=A0AAV3Y8U8_9GAST|nr:hypothetical protein PoB_000604000 [Plakobranchus ocellatus]
MSVPDKVPDDDDLASEISSDTFLWCKFGGAVICGHIRKSVEVSSPAVKRKRKDHRTMKWIPSTPEPTNTNNPGRGRRCNNAHSVPSFLSWGVKENDPSPFFQHSDLLHNF